MIGASTPPAGPRGAIGAAAEEAAAVHLASQGWSILARNVRVDRDEIDIVALEPGKPPTLVTVEVRSRSTPRFGSPRESVDVRKVGRLYRAALSLRRQGYHGLRNDGAAQPWRVDLLTLTRGA